MVNGWRWDDCVEDLPGGLHTTGVFDVQRHLTVWASREEGESGGGRVEDVKS